MINRQRHRTTCGIVAIKNALEFKGRKKKKDSYENLLKYSIRNLGFKHDGMHNVQIYYALKLKGIKHKIIRQASFKDISRELGKGRGVIFLFRYAIGNGGSNGHFTFIDKETPKQFRAWNNTRKRSCMWRKKTMAKYIRYSNRHHANSYSQAIVII